MAKRRNFYERCGFEAVAAGAALPPALALEQAVGAVYARVVAGEGLLVMRCRPGGSDNDDRAASAG